MKLKRFFSSALTLAIVFGGLFTLLPSLSNVQGQTTVLSSESKTGLYLVGLRDDVSFESAQVTVEGLEGTIKYFLPLSRIAVIDIGEAGRTLLGQHKDVRWIEEEVLADATNFASLSIPFGSLFTAPNASAAEQIDVFILDSGAGSGIKYTSKESVQDPVGPIFETPDALENKHGERVAKVFNEANAADPNVRLHSIKVTNDKEGKASPALIVEGIHHAVENGAEVINLSFSGRDALSQAEKEAFQFAKDRGVVVVVSAGNDAGKQGPNRYATDPNTISVGALDSTGEAASYTDGLTPLDKADFFALGELKENGKLVSQGTSLSAPRVAAAVAKIKAKADPAHDANGDGILDVDEVRAALKAGIANGEFPGFRTGDDVVGEKVTLAPRPEPRPEEPPPLPQPQPSPSPAPAPTPAPFSPGTPFAFAQSNGLVPCGGAGQPACQACHVVQLADNVLKFLMTMSVIAATIAFVWAGFLYLTAAPNPAQIEKAHKIFWNVLIGLVVVLASFLIIDVILRTLTGKDLNVIGKIQCVDQPTAGGNQGNNASNFSLFPGEDALIEQERQRQIQEREESNGNQTI